MTARTGESPGHSFQRSAAWARDRQREPRRAGLVCAGGGGQDAVFRACLAEQHLSGQRRPVVRTVERVPDDGRPAVEVLLERCPGGPQPCRRGAGDDDPAALRVTFHRHRASRRGVQQMFASAVRDGRGVHQGLVVACSDTDGARKAHWADPWHRLKSTATCMSGRFSRPSVSFLPRTGWRRRLCCSISGFHRLWTIAVVDNPECLRSEASFAALCGVSAVERSSGGRQHRRLKPGARLSGASWPVAGPCDARTPMRNSPEFLRGAIPGCAFDGASCAVRYVGLRGRMRARVGVLSSGERRSRPERSDLN
ncbi:hypothetical protein SAMN05216268_109291 [Streptomyces yunnanensis]|uniref:Uncharacterized protein n=1 Tax=Streptomyces yunnanensis TaxID=156453 RepID=A0A9X8MY29_9ACTN|nr:hypothetical protein SAMN05216268_109291 [Streptomyces yunnanensis]